MGGLPDANILANHGDWQIAGGVRIISTPGHTPGHRSVVVDADEGRIVICAQAAYTPADFSALRTITALAAWLGGGG